MDEKYVQFLLHDPIGNVEAQITNFNKDYLESAAAVGMIFIGVKSDGSRKIVTPDEVKEPKIAAMGGFPIVLPSYVDAKVDEIMEIIQQLLSAVSDNIPTVKKEKIQNSITSLRVESQQAIESEKEMLGSIKPLPNIINASADRKEN